MTRFNLMRAAYLAFVGSVICFWPIDSHGQAAPTVPAQMVVTEEARHGGEVPPLTRDDVVVYEGRERDQVVDWIPLQGEKARLELFVLLDDASRTSLGSQLDDLRQFVAAQPGTAAVAIGYMRDGVVNVAQPFTTDHEQAARAIRLPLGDVGTIASPYLSLQNLIHHWPTNPPQETLMNRWPDIPIRHEVVMITDGVDRFGGDGPVDPYVDEASEDAQRAGVIVYAIYATGVGRYGQGLWRVYWGRNYLSQLADQTGGELYFVGYDTPPSFGPYFDDISRKLNHQFLLAFLARPGNKSGLQRIRLNTEVRNAELIAAENVWVPAESH
jgi:hypothetical protein